MSSVSFILQHKTALLI